MSESLMYKKITKIDIFVRNLKQNIYPCSDVPEDMPSPDVVMKALYLRISVVAKAILYSKGKVLRSAMIFLITEEVFWGEALFISYNLSLTVKFTKFLGHQLTHSLDPGSLRIGSMCFHLSVFLVPRGMHEIWWIFNKYLFKNG